MPVPDLPQPRRDGNRSAGGQARGYAAPRRRQLADRPAQDHPRPERADDEESDILLLKGGARMPNNGAGGYRPGLVDIDSGLISREIFVNEEIYAQEQERVFARSWL